MNNQERLKLAHQKINEAKKLVEEVQKNSPEDRDKDYQFFALAMFQEGEELKLDGLIYTNKKTLANSLIHVCKRNPAVRLAIQMAENKITELEGPNPEKELFELLSRIKRGI